MRCYQEVGLTPQAKKFLEENAERVVSSSCPKCGHPLHEDYKVLSSFHIDSFYGDGPTLRRIQLKDGRVAEEYVQAEPWSSGPVCFLAIKVDGKEMFLWSEEDIDRA